MAVMSCNGCTAVRGANPNLKKKKKLREREREGERGREREITLQRQLSMGLQETQALYHGNQFNTKYATKFGSHAFLHFHARKDMIS